MPTTSGGGLACGVGGGSLGGGGNCSCGGGWGLGASATLMGGGFTALGLGGGGLGSSFFSSGGGGGGGFWTSTITSSTGRWTTGRGRSAMRCRYQNPTPCSTSDTKRKMPTTMSERSRRGNRGGEVSTAAWLMRWALRQGVAGAAAGATSFSMLSANLAMPWPFTVSMSRITCPYAMLWSALMMARVSLSLATASDTFVDSSASLTGAPSK